MLGVAACTSSSEEPTGANASPATCGPQMSRFPVHAPHNIGYDAASCGDGDKKSDLVTLSENGLGGWGERAYVERSVGSGFASMAWGAFTPAHLRNGGAR